MRANRLFCSHFEFFCCCKLHFTSQNYASLSRQQLTSFLNSERVGEKDYDMFNHFAGFHYLRLDSTIGGQRRMHVRP